MARNALGRGLGALIREVEVEPQVTAPAATTASGAAVAPAPEIAGRPLLLDIDLLDPSPYQPRTRFPEAALEELAQSIRSSGIIQPLVVRKIGARYQLIAGERRWQAAQRAGLHEVPVVVLDVSDVEALELAIVENVQREDLNPLEEAAGYQSLISEFKYHQDDIAKVVGKSRSHVANMLRLLKLPEFVKTAIRSGQFSAGHARALIGHPDPERIAQQIIERGLNVRQVEALARDHGKGQTRQPRQKEADTIAMEKQVSDALGLAVTVDHGSSGGAVHIKYRSLDQLRDIVRRLVRAS